MIGWRIANGALQMAHCKWRIANGALQMAHCKWHFVNKVDFASISLIY